ncbi:MAG: hypothetical protein JXJ04_18820 [Spirochaetales bacterium]|nr:hypothetical protein [Spirochaetales bacterium]
MREYDVYAFGMISFSTLYILDPQFSFPQADGYGEIKETLRMTGGEAANSSIVLGKLGVKVKIDGNWLGADEKGRYVRDILEKYEIDTSALTMRDSYRGVEEIVFSDKKTRTVFGTYCNLLFTERQWNIPRREDITNAKIVCLDPFFKEQSLLASTYCTDSGTPYVTIDLKPQDPLAKNAEVLIISGEFREREYKDADKTTLLKEYSEHVKGTVIFTSGETDILYRAPGQGEKRMKAFTITPVDTAGAGDSFRAGIIYGMLLKWDMEKSIRFASALAAKICTSFPGVLHCPDYKAVVEFIKSSGLPGDF